LRVVSVVGARPNFVKLAALEPLLSKRTEHVIIHTGQHYDYELSKIFFEGFSIPEPDYFLNVGSGSHGYQIGEGIKRIEEALQRESPNLVMVYGDTNSTLAGALAAAKAGFEVAHVEAGLRSFEQFMPEEINRRLTDQVSTLLFAPTENAVENLKREGVLGEIHLVGDVHVDVLKKWIKTADRSKILEDLNLNPKEYLLVTIHRAENTDNKQRLTEIIKALSRIEMKLVFPIHPRTEKALKKTGLIKFLTGKNNIEIIKPLGYMDFIKLLKEAWKVLTDSGGVQREAFLLGVPAIVPRRRTEWVELVKVGWLKLVDASHERILQAIKEFNPQGSRPPLLGDGKASKRIVEIVTREF